MTSAPDYKVDEVKAKLFIRLESKGMAQSLIPSFMRMLSNSLSASPYRDHSAVKRRLQYLGWDDFELDYYTFQLATECLSASGMKHQTYVPGHFFESHFLPEN